MNKAGAAKLPLLNGERPLVFCPGCSHEKVVKSLAGTFDAMELSNNEITMVSDIGCSGLFDTFFNTHAFHGLHGRVLTYAAGIKLAQPGQTVVATMGDGGVGIGGTHLLAACRRNLDMTLLILNNYNFGMTGGQYSSTTPSQAQVGSAFLNKLEPALNVCETLVAAGAPYVVRCSTYEDDLADKLEKAIRYKGFSVVEILGICPGRYTQKNLITPKTIEAELETQAVYDGEIDSNRRAEYGEAYREVSSTLTPKTASGVIKRQFEPLSAGRKEVLILGAAGQRINTAAEVLGLAAMSAGLNVTQKSEYDITVLRGPSIAELILSPEPIDYTGMDKPGVVLALAPEGVSRREPLLKGLDETTLVLCAKGVELPATGARVEVVDFKALGVKKSEQALAIVTLLAKNGMVVSGEMVSAALNHRFSGKVLQSALAINDKIAASIQR